jgi:hypothetical protein
VLGHVSFRGLNKKSTNVAKKAFRDQEFPIERLTLEKNVGRHVRLVCRRRITDWTTDLNDQIIVPSLGILLAPCKVIPFITTSNRIQVVLWARPLRATRVCDAPTERLRMVLAASHFLEGP